MINYQKVTLAFEHRRLQALQSALEESTGESVSMRLLGAFDELYQQYVPEEQRAAIEAEITKDEIIEKAEVEAKRRFAVFHIREGGEDAIFRSDIFKSPMLAASRCRLFLRGELNDQPETFAEAFVDAEEITPQEYARVCENINCDQRITAIMEFNLDEGTVGICDSSDNAWNTYKLHDISVAAYKAYRSDSKLSDARREIFNQSLAGKEIVFDEDESAPLTEDEDADEAPVMQM